MRKYVAFAIVVTGGLFIVTSQLRSVQGAANSTPADISVTADGVVHAQPDTARLWIGVEGFGPTLVPTDREADQRLASVVATLRALGIADQHMRTAGMTVAPQYTTQDGQRQELTGYIARSMLEVETEDIQGVPALIDTAMAAGANRVDRIQFESSVLDQLRGQARDLAWQAARAQADQLAIRAGTRLDRVTSVDQPMLDEATTTIQPDRVTAYSSSPGVTTSMPSGEIEVRARLHVVWSTQ
jgi:uncharacterized protein YggE